MSQCTVRTGHIPGSKAQRECPVHGVKSSPRHVFQAEQVAQMSPIRSDAEESYRAAAEEAGLGVMGHVLEVIEGRGEVDADDLARVDADTIESMYAGYVEPCVDSIQNQVGGRRTVEDAPEGFRAHDHVKRISEEALLPVVGELLSVVIDREEVHDDLWASMDADDIEDLYDQYVGPMTDRLQREFE